MKRTSNWIAASIVVATCAVTLTATGSINADDTATTPTSEVASSEAGDDSASTPAAQPCPSTSAPVATEAPASSNDVGDGTVEAVEPLEIAVLSPDYAAQPAAKEAIDFFEAAAEAHGHTVTVVDTNSDNAAMNAEITTAVSQGVDAIVVAFGTPQEFGDGLADAVEADIPVFGLDTGGLAEGILVNVTTDNGFLGEQSAQAIIDEIGEGGTVAMIHFDPFEPVRLRAEAARALFEGNGIEVVEYIQGDPEDSTGFAAAAVGDLLAKYPAGELDAIWAGWDASALGAYQATLAADRTEILVTGVDGQAFAIAEVATGGNWIATVRQDWDTIATTELGLIEAYFAGEEPAETIVYVPAVVITAENACT